MKIRKRFFSLAAKLNILIVALMLIMATGLVSIIYRVQCANIDEIYFNEAEKYAKLAVDNMLVDEIKHLIDVVDTEGFKAAREQATAANDEQILKDWLDKQPTEIESLTLWDDCDMALWTLESFRQGLDITYVYIEYDRDGVTYTLLDPSEPLTEMGLKGENLPEFEPYMGNQRIPPTVSKGKYGWLYTAAEPLIYEGEAIATIGVDLDMNDIMAQRRRFLLSSIVFVLLLTITAVIVSLFLIRRLALKPIQQLADTACSFAASGEGYTRADIESLDIHRNDELGDLAREIQSMQTRILDYTEYLTRITAERERAGTELRMATRIQAAMLPSTFPPFPNERSFDIYATMTPAKEVGGDFYDFFFVDDHRLAMLIADVSDKGVPAALFMMASKIIIGYQAQMGGTPAEILTAVNAQVCKTNKSKMFVTVWMGILDLRTGVMTCSSAGHEYPFLKQGNQGFKLFRDQHGLVVGALPFARFTDYTLTLGPGDALFVYTDGVPEATNAENQRYGLERTERTLNDCPDASPQEILQHVKSDIDAFVGEAKQFDDLTMLCLKYHGRQ